VSDDGRGAPKPADGPGLPADSSQGQLGKTPEQIAHMRSPRDPTALAWRHAEEQGAIIRLTPPPRMTVFRLASAIVWGVISVGFGAGAIYNLVAHTDIGAFLAGAAISALAGWYDYRIWTFKTRRLFLIL
jgi:hypothetical protein